MNRQEVLVEMTAGITNVFLGPDDELRPVPQSQVRSDSPVRLLQASGGICEYRRQRHRDRFRRREARHEEAEKAWKARLKPVEDAIAAIEKPTVTG